MTAGSGIDRPPSGLRALLDSRLWHFFLWPAVLVLLFYPFRPDGAIFPQDEGFWLATFEALLQGKRLYRDVWMLYGPLPILGNYLGHFGAEPTVYSVRFLFWLENVAGLYTVYLCLHKWCRDKLMRTVFTLLLFIVPNAAHTFAIPMSARYGAGFLPLLFWPDFAGAAPASRVAALCGAAAGVAYWASPEVGTAAFAAGLVIFFRRVNWRPLLIYAGAAAAVVGAGLTVIGFYGGLQHFFQTTVMNTGRMMVFVRLPAPAFEWSRLAEVVAFYAPVATYLAVGAAAARGAWDGERWRFPLALSVYGMLTAVSAWVRTDRWHIFFAFTPCLVLWAVLPELVPSFREKTRSALRLATLILAGFAVVPPYIQSLRKERKQRAALIATALERVGKARLPYYQANGYELLVGAIDAVVPKGEPFFFFFYNGAIYFLADRPNPSRTFDAFLPDQQKDVVADLEKSGVRWVIRDRDMTHFDGVPIDDFLSELSGYLRAHFRRKFEAGPFIFLERAGS